MSLSQFLFRTSLGLGLGITSGLGAGCGGGDDSCGPGNAPESGLIADNPQVHLTYGKLSGGPNNDCPAAGAPAGVISLSIEGTQQDGQGRITLCVGRPDLLGGQPLALGVDAASPVRVIDFVGSDASCSYTIDRSHPPTGEAQVSGMCDNGNDPAGFALVLTGNVTLTRTCGASVDTTTVMLHGRTAVTGPPRGRIISG